MSYDCKLGSRIFCWGGNQSGQLGIGTLEKEKVNVPTVIKDALIDLSVAQISCGEKHTLFVLQNGSLYSCGNNDYGQLGHSSRTSRPEKVDCLSSKSVIQAAVGAAHSLCLTSKGEVFSWGDNSSGQLGRGDVDSELGRTPMMIKIPHTVVQIAAGRNHNLLLTDDGRLFSWGSNDCGQLGVGCGSRQAQPMLISSLSGVPVSQLACGGSHSFALTRSGTMFGWGRNSFGQLGMSDNQDRPHPATCKILRTQKVTYVTCGEDHTACLTLDGGLFMFGAGTYGQLGHGTKTHDTVPKKVQELMGSTVTQVACGRCHTVAYVTDNGRLHSFGQGSNGQLGLEQSGLVALPTNVKGPFVAHVPANCGSPMEIDTAGPVFVINMIAAGGDQTFVATSVPERVVAPKDYRVVEERFQVQRLTPTLLDCIGKLQTESQLTASQEQEIIKIFSSAACLNSSFLAGTKHYSSSKENHGVDMELVASELHKIGEGTHPKILQKIVACLHNSLFPSLPTSPPDVEALRLYLILPHLPMFEQPKNFRELQRPFSRAVINMDDIPSRVIDRWWGTLPQKCFLHLISIFKETVIYLLGQPLVQENKDEVQTRMLAMFNSLEMLKRLFVVNELNNQVVPYNKFYVKTLGETVNLKEDYLQWFQEQVTKTGQRTLFFCNYPFTFDAVAKSLLLETDARIQMASSLHEAQRQNLASLFLPINPVNQYLVFKVSRDGIVKDTLHQLLAMPSADLKKPMKVIFEGEEATIDAGGVRKEFFLLLLREVLDPKYGMFKLYEESHLQWFSPFPFEDHGMYMLIGILCGLAIYNSVIIQLSFPLALYKKLLNRPTTIEDISELMPTVGRSFEKLLGHEGNDVEEIFCLTFEISQEYLGELRTEELVPGGKHKPVTKENRSEFVERYGHYIFNTMVKEQFDSFNTGFHKVCGGKVLNLFHPDELRALVTGNEDFDFHELEKNTEYKEEFHRYHPTVKYFWDVFHDLSLHDKKKFLLFLTGCDKIPIQGMKYVKMIIQPMKVPESFLPVAHTCFNLLDLPLYTSKEQMKEKLTIAIGQTEGFGLV
ncbi:probable E3 ubiquitin-protein ligase HERC4 [Dreissena polymorpha]|uniref:HECT domain-containing protein n=1 Tax=Dreissena polymorpha TaxID=45954 RepID=A0A9D4LRG1_DREPO|nr:probable E3 ubiquitin-protein ligase HERC4 [Dreissena polymorpha]KAH3862509.1 hypothetical protein DPMN_025476 [Dreissena polymorpha]